MLEFPRLKAIRGIKSALLIGVTLVIVLAVYQAERLTVDNLEKLDYWPRRQALFIRDYGENAIEIEVATAFFNSFTQKQIPENCFAHESDRSCLLLPANPYVSFSLFEEIELLQNPEHPEQLEVLSMTGLWLPVFGYAIGMGLLIVVGRLFARSGVGEDKTWANGAWIASESAPQRIGFSRVDAEQIREPDISLKGVLFWSTMFLGLASIAIPGILLNSGVDRIEAGIIVVLTVGFVASLWYSAVRSYTRIIYQDGAGFIDANLFEVKRVPWIEVASVELVNLNEQAQAWHRRRFGGGRRPPDLNVYVVSDKQGRKILHLGQHMIPSSVFSAFLTRLHTFTDQKTMPVSEADSVRLMAAWNAGLSRIAQPKSLFDKENRVLLIALFLMLAPFVLATGYLCYQSAWFVYGAERAIGKVVEIKDEALPSLVIEYRTQDATPLRIESDGSESYAAFEVGDTITVFYDSADPENARPDLFLELWLMPMIVGFVSGIVVLVVVLIARAATAPLPGM